MNPIPIDLAVEDALSEAVARKLLESCEQPFAVGTIYNRGGYGYLRRTIGGWNSAAKGKPFLVLTDLDDKPCTSALIGDWLKVPMHPNLFFRLAIREVEAWLLADAEGLSQYLAIRRNLIPEDPEDLPDPKQTLLTLAGQSRRKQIREDIVPKKGSTAQIGPGYNLSLGEFVRTHWNVGAAASKAQSLRRALHRLSTFSPSWQAGDPPG